MNRVGMVVCASHAGYRTARELIDASSEPVIFSHSNPRAVWNSPRNIPDDLMIACASRGGIIGLNGIGPFLGENDARIETFLRHIDYALDLIGEDHVGLALDYCFGEEDGMSDFMASYPALFPSRPAYQHGMRMISPWRLGEIAEALTARGIRSSTLRKIFGENHLRIAETVWR
jgi:membrane dipeptidase